MQHPQVNQTDNGVPCWPVWSIHAFVHLPINETRKLKQKSYFVPILQGQEHSSISKLTEASSVP